MYLTLALVVLVAAIVVLFSQEFIQLFKKILTIKGAKLVLPLLIVSWLVFTFDYWVLWGIYYYGTVLNSITAFLSNLLPFQTGAYPLVMILLLTAISVVPVILWEHYLWKQNYKHYQYPYLTSTLIWIASSIVLIMTL
ncbi:hypothetical protein [Legionella shakespearei]|uniref:Uncharacterized protein n=1 Tax=Legionella shakespearei DSM 23087 TaxID=1122169 RepID=A0A0W0ZB89_9GAMM|nr:hypothetical protein [Legionella shakespearei]KTD66428.1 hypothetical protein Lsha_0110 [Legionella shakespearei DSM 23087]